MNRPPAPSNSPWQRTRRLLEKYTPDTTGRQLLFGAITGSVGFYAVVVALGFIFNPGLWSLFVVPSTAIVGIFLLLTAAVALWPVYLSAIGKSQGSSPTNEPTHSPKRATETELTSPLSETERLKQQYLRDELSEAELEQRISEVLARKADESERQIQDRLTKTTRYERTEETT